MDDELTEVNMFFPKKQDMPRDLNIFLHESDGFLDDDVWRVKRNVVKKTEYIDLIRELLEIPSCVLSSIWIENGVFQTEFIFHNSQAKFISDLILEKVSNMDEVNLEFMGPNTGYMNLLREINIRCPLSVVQTQISPPEYQLEDSENPMGDKWTRIVKMPYGGGEIRAVYFMDGIPSVPSAAKEIFSGSLYESTTDNAFVSYIITEMHLKRIPAIAKIHEFSMPKFNSWIIFPSVFRNDVLKIVSNSLEDLPSWHPVLKRMVSLNDI
jgi:hypothetical protein